MGGHRGGISTRIKCSFGIALLTAIVLVSLVAPLLLSKVSAATYQEIHLYPVADAMCDNANPSTNYGSEQTWDVGYISSGNSIRKSYVKFDIRSLNLSAVTNATLVLRGFFGGVYPPIIIDVNECSDYWQQSTITWDNAPFLQDKIGELSVYSGGTYIESLNVTDAVRDELDGFFSIVLTNQTAVENSWARFYSAERTSLTPYLIIWSETPAGPAPPSGEWTLTGIDGDLNYSLSPLMLTAEGENVCQANFTRGNLNKTFADGEGFQVNFTVSIKGDRREWWWWEGTKRFYFSFGLHGTGGAAYSLFYIAHEQGIAMMTSEAKVGSQLQCNVGKPNLAIGETVDTTDALWYIQFIRINSTTAKAIYATNIFSGNEAYQNVTEGALKTFAETLTVDPSVWNDPELVLYAGHDGSGTFQCAYGDVYIGAITEIEDQAPPSLNPNPFQWIMDGFNFIYSLAVIVGTFAGQFLPILPFIFLFYLLDVIISSVMAGNVKLIGDFALKIWGFLRELWDTLVNFGRLIWDTITFWT